MRNRTYGTVTTFAPRAPEGKIQGRIIHALNHPDCPVVLLADEVQQLARHIAYRITDRWKKDEENDEQ